MARRVGLLVLGLIFASSTMASGASAVDTLGQGKVELQSAGALAFGPEGILFVGDSTAATIWAIDTSDRQKVSPATSTWAESTPSWLGCLVALQTRY